MKQMKGFTEIAVAIYHFLDKMKMQPLSVLCFWFLIVNDT